MYNTRHMHHKAAIARPLLAWAIGALCSHLPAAGMYISTELWIQSSPALPPTANKQSARVATPALDLGTPIEAMHDHLPSLGSYASTLASLVRVLVIPPATYSRPASQACACYLSCASNCILLAFVLVETSVPEAIAHRHVLVSSKCTQKPRSLSLHFHK